VGIDMRRRGVADIENQLFKGIGTEEHSLCSRRNWPRVMSCGEQEAKRRSIHQSIGLINRNNITKQSMAKR